MLRGIRGAITVSQNSRTEIIDAVSELLIALQKANSFDTNDIGAIIFSSTPDLNAAFPAAAARALGWTNVPLFGTQEIDNEDGLRFCIRVLILWNTDLAQTDIRHIYLKDAIILRQDITK